MLYSCALLGNYSIFTLQGDAIRNISGYFKISGVSGGFDGGTGVFSTSDGKTHPQPTNRGDSGYAFFNANTVVSTANENRPNNLNLKYFIKV